MGPIAKRRKLDRVEEITFDPAARQEYLTGFHKRKQQRKQHARETAVKREKEDRVKERRQIREQRKEDLEHHVAAVNAELRKQNADLSDADSEAEFDGEDVEWNGIADGVQDIAQDEEYVDEDKYTTVTVEAMNQSGEDSEGDEARHVEEAKAKMNGNNPQLAKKKRTWSKDPTKAKAKKRKFRYESKAERYATRQKQKTRNQAAKARRVGQ